MASWSFQGLWEFYGNQGTFHTHCLKDCPRSLELAVLSPRNSDCIKTTQRAMHSAIHLLSRARTRSCGLPPGGKSWVVQGMPRTRTLRPSTGLKFRVAGTQSVGP